MPYIGKKPADIIATVIDTTTGTFSGEVDAGSLDVSGNADIDGITNLDNTDIDGTLDVSGTVTVGDGAVGTPAISFASDTNTGIYRGGTDILKFVTAGTDAVTIDASQNVTLAGSVTGVTKITVNGTGTSNFTSTATSPIQINGTSIPTLTIRNSTTPVELQMRATTGEGLVRTSTNHPLVFAVNASEKARIDTSGNLLVGKTSSNLSTAGSEFASDGLVRFTRSNVNAVVNFNKLNNDGDIVSFRKDDTQVGSIGNNGTELFIGTPSGSGGYIRLQSAGIVPATSTGANSDGTMQLGTASGRFSDLYLSGSVLTSNIYGQNDGNTGIQFEGSDLITIHTGGAERMRIDSSGNVGIGTTSPSDNLHLAESGATSSFIRFSNSNVSNGWSLGAQSSGRFQLTQNGVADRLIVDSSGKLLINTTSTLGAGQGVLHLKGASGNTVCVVQVASNGERGLDFRNSSGTEVGSISVNSSSTAYNTSSDHRLKENVTADWDATTRLKQLNPVRFNFIADADTTVDGFLAHEVQSVVPEAISGTHNEVDDNGSPIYQGIDQSKLVPLLVKTIQELEARITALENA
jgi:hypothetical protein